MTSIEIKTSGNTIDASGKTESRNALPHAFASIRRRRPALLGIAAILRRDLTSAHRSRALIARVRDSASGWPAWLILRSSAMLALAAALAGCSGFGVTSPANAVVDALAMPADASNRFAFGGPAPIISRTGTAPVTGFEQVEVRSLRPGALVGIARGLHVDRSEGRKRGVLIVSPWIDRLIASANGSDSVLARTLDGIDASRFAPQGALSPLPGLGMTGEVVVGSERIEVTAWKLGGTDAGLYLINAPRDGNALVAHGPPLEGRLAGMFSYYGTLLATDTQDANPGTVSSQFFLHADFDAETFNFGANPLAFPGSNRTGQGSSDLTLSGSGFLDRDTGRLHAQDSLHLTPSGQPSLPGGSPVSSGSAAMHGSFHGLDGAAVTGVWFVRGVAGAFVGTRN